MERSAQREAKGTWRRRKRRRRSSRDQVHTSPPFLRPSRHWGSGASSAEDADASSTSSLEVKENQGERIPSGRDPLQKRHPPSLFPRNGPRPKEPPMGPAEQRRCRRRAAWSQKNALVQLHELLPGLRFDTAAAPEPLHGSAFSVSVEVNGRRFEARGPTKKRAKLRAAELVLRSLQVPGALDGTHPPEPALRCGTAEQRHWYQRRQLVRLALDWVSPGPNAASLVEQLGPVALLDQLCPGLRYLCLSERVPGRPVRRFVMVVRVDGRVFEGCAHSKRRAKALAAAAALRALHGRSLGPETGLLQDGRSGHQLPQVFSEAIFHLVRDKYSDLTHGGFSHKVLAGIVLTQGLDLASARVVSLATGTKCLDSDSAGERGSTLSDCHAEVICRRALLRFLYAQLELLLCPSADSEEGSVFAPDEASGHFRLRSHVRFHMFVSSSPCGDARLSCPYETSARPKTPQCPSRFRWHLRVKASGGEGTRRAPGRAGPSSMSCTDKMAKWSVVGLQGALLSRLVEPVYLHSLTVATLSHTGHLGRAMARRLAPVRHLPFPYRRQQLMLGSLSSTEARPTGKAPNVSVNWTLGDAGLEEISTLTGRRTGSGGPSQLCRCSLMARWQRLQQQLSVPAAEAPAVTYAASKAAAGRYQTAVQRFGSGLQSAGLGTWLRKAPEPTYLSVAGQ